jgi:hypothetical protein
VVWNVNEKRPPGATEPEFHTVASDVDVCATESVLVHVTVVPTATSARSGLKAVLVNVDAPIGIETDDAGPDGAGDGAGSGEGEDGDEDPLPHAIVNISSIETTHTRIDDMTFSKDGSRK